MVVEDIEEETDDHVKEVTAATDPAPPSSAEEFAGSTGGDNVSGD